VRFDLDEGQRAIVAAVDELMTRKFPLPVTRLLVDGDAGAGAVIDELHRALADMGVFGLLVPEEHGGAGLELLDIAIVGERLGFAAAPGPFLGSVLATYAIVLGGTAEQQARWLPGLASGTLKATYAVCEGDLWNPERGGFRLAGTLRGAKDWVLDAGGDLDLLVVATAEGLTVVSGDASGLHRSSLRDLDLTRRLTRITFEDVDHERLGGGPALALRIRDAARVLLAADAYGGASRCVDIAVNYAKTREQFGVPIGTFQAVKHQLADMDLAVGPAQGLYWYAAHAFDRVPEDASRFAALAKAHLTDRYTEVARRLVEIYGGIGYTWECDAHIFLKRAVLDRVQFGMPWELRAEVAAATDW
jgi:alkylation response protein AidB-like acyl-CoA dehydrogenase